MKIDLPTLPRMARAHIYPFQIAWQTLEFVQGAMFHVIFMDIAAGQRVRQPGATTEIEREMIVGGTTQDVLDLHWKAWIKYKVLFEKFVFLEHDCLNAKPLGLVSPATWSFHLFCSPSNRCHSPIIYADVPDFKG